MPESTPQTTPTPHTKESLLHALSELGISHTTHDHPALHRVEDAQAWRATLENDETAHCKNLFLKDKKGALWLIVAREETTIRLNQLSKHIKAARLSFANEDLLYEILGVRPGSVTPFALINDRNAQRVNLVLDASMMAYEKLTYHPLTNEASTLITKADFLKFIEWCGHTPQIVDLETVTQPE
ncbi:MAG: Ala-tRNA(Pro) deacylase [Parvibaculaceae bacterium]|jgi:Ala-tRNA(Pro) deacylase|nr:prolyl-tRNA synthetase associated domain-containing protein [Parvibaculaceae bacterium]